jgi:hypothetical protein
MEWLNIAVNLNTAVNSLVKIAGKIFAALSRGNQNFFVSSLLCFLFLTLKVYNRDRFEDLNIQKILRTKRG